MPAPRHSDESIANQGHGGTSASGDTRQLGLHVVNGHNATADKFLDSGLPQIPARDSLSECAFDGISFGVAYAKYRPELLRYANRFRLHGAKTAEDIVQEAFISALLRSEEFRGSEKSVRAWLYKIVENMSKNALRRVATFRRHCPTVNDNIHDLPSYLTPHTQNLSQLDEQCRRSGEELGLQLLGNLPEKFARVFWAYEVERLSYEEISLSYSIPVGTVRSRIFRARKFLLAAAKLRGLQLEEVI